MVFSSTDVGPSLLRIGLTLAALALIAGIVVWRGRRRGSTTLSLDVALTLSAWWVLMSVLGLALNTINVLVGNVGVTVDGAALQIPWPGGVPCDAGMDAGAQDGATLLCTSATIDPAVVEGASMGVRALAALGLFSSTALAAIPAVLIAVICFLTLRGLPFSRTVTRALVAGAVAVVVFGLASQLLPDISGVLALREVFPRDSDLFPESFQLSATWDPFAGALALVALAAVFRHGIRLQHEKELLQKETEGLV